jgi:hypothetical protein
MVRTFWVVLVLASGVLAFAASTASAAANFHGAPTFTINSSGQLTCSGDVSGLGNVETTTGSCTASSAADYQCINNGGKNPAAGNKRTTTGVVSGSDTFPVRNGRTKGSITLDPTDAGSFSCPGGQTLFLVGVCYSDISLNIGGAVATGGTVCSGPLLVRQ